MKKLLMLTIAAALLAASPAHAQRFDLASFRCKDFVASSKDSIGILMWLEGYFSEENASPIVDYNTMNEHGSKIGEYCGRNPTHSVITAAEKVFEK